MNKSISLLLGLSLGCAALTAQATNVYEWHDAQGVEHMSDTPPPGDQDGVTKRKINGREVNSFDMSGVNKREEASSGR